MRVVFMGYISRAHRTVESRDAFGPRQDWSKIWTPGVLDRRR
jgi:hypothetical protein